MLLQQLGPELLERNYNHPEQVCHIIKGFGEMSLKYCADEKLGMKKMVKLTERNWEILLIKCFKLRSIAFTFKEHPIRD